jgi:hypothetical protein
MANLLGSKMVICSIVGLGLGLCSGLVWDQAEKSRRRREQENQNLPKVGDREEEEEKQDDEQLSKEEEEDEEKRHIREYLINQKKEQYRRQSRSSRSRSPDSVKNIRRTDRDDSIPKTNSPQQQHKQDRIKKDSRSSNSREDEKKVSRNDMLRTSKDEEVKTTNPEQQLPKKIANPNPNLLPLTFSTKDERVLPELRFLEGLRGMKTRNPKLIVDLDKAFASYETALLELTGSDTLPRSIGAYSILSYEIEDRINNGLQKIYVVIGSPGEVTKFNACKSTLQKISAESASNLRTAISDHNNRR